MDKTLGVWLRETREAKGRSIAGAAAATRIRPRFLVMMEDGDFASFPGGELQIRGFLRVVSRYLELDADEVLARYDAEFHGTEPEQEAEAETAEQVPSRQASAAEPREPWRPLGLTLAPGADRRGLLTTGLVWAAIAVVIIGLGAVIFGVVSQRSGGSSAASAPLPTPLPTQAQMVVESAEPTPDTAPEPVVGVSVSLEPTEHVWVRVTVDNKIAFVGFLSPDGVKTWSGNDEVLVETGNGGGVEATVNGQLIGLLGARGDVVRRAWIPTGETEPA